MKIDIYQEVTNSIIELLENGSADTFRTPFAKLTSNELPTNINTNLSYQGINAVILWVAQAQQNFNSNEWGTYKHWKAKGAQVKKGESSEHVIFYKQVITEEPDANGDGESSYNMIRFYSVFNADQVEGYEVPSAGDKMTVSHVEKIERIDSFIKNTGATITDNQRQACFLPLTNQIHMPPKALFFNNDGQDATENYYAVLLHELTHWTGGYSRLDREIVSTKSNKKKYAFEELIAELGSAFLCSKFGIKMRSRTDHASYINSWLQVLKSDKKIIFKAAAQAQKAVSHLEAYQGIQDAQSNGFKYGSNA